MRADVPPEGQQPCRAIEACPFDASTAREVCEAVLPGDGPNGVTNISDVAGLQCGVDAFRNLSDIGFKQKGPGRYARPIVVI
jgi:hypothetical protein